MTQLQVQAQEEVQLDADTEEVQIIGLPPRDAPYAVRFAEGPCIVLVLGAKPDSALTRFEHPNLLARVPVTHHFKHYGAGGSKWWTEAEGVDLYLAVPKEAIALVGEAGYSYPKVRIGGEDLGLNVSGGCGGSRGPGWEDSVGVVAHTSVGHTVKTARALAAVALTPEEWQALGSPGADRMTA